MCQASDGSGGAAAEVIHIRNQDEQPYGSERRCCNWCGLMLWGADSPPFVETWKEFYELPNSCRKRRA